MLRTCIVRKLCWWLEFDGEQHDAAKDVLRDDWFRQRGIITLRIPNREFLFIDKPSGDWMERVVQICETRTGRRAFPPPQPSPNAVRGGS